MTTLIFVENTSSNDVPVILNALRSESINAPGGGLWGTSESEAVVLVNNKQVKKAIQIILRLGFNTRVV